MTDTFDKLKAKLAAGTITDEELGDSTLTDEERIWLSAERHDKARSDSPQITMEAYLEASKKLDTSAEDSPEYAAALKLVEAYEGQA